MTRRGAGALLAAMAGLAAAGRLSAQAPPSVTESVAVRVMDLDVVVLDRSGRRVPDLAREDFHVRVDRTPIEIDYFAAVDEGLVHAPDLSTLSPDLVLKQYEKGPEGYVPRHFLIILDDGNMTPGDRKRALEGLEDLVTRLGVADDALVLLEDRQPRILQDWTSSKETLLAALQAAGRAGGIGGMRRLERERQAVREIDSTRRRSSRVTQARLYQEQITTEIRKMLADMSESLSLLAGRPGKKVLLDVSGGFELEPGASLVAYAARSSLPPLDFRSDVSPDLKKFTDQANAMEVTVFTADARGIPAPGVDSSNEPALAQTSFFAREDTRTPLVRMAEETGGRALVNQNDFEKGFADLLREVSSYYSIGVNLKNVPAGGPHRVEVAVDRAGLTVRARRSYTVESEDERLQRRVVSTLLTQTSFADLAVSVRTAPARREKGDFLLPVEISVPARDVAFQTEGDRGNARLDYFLASVDDRGEKSPIARVSQTFTIPLAETRSPRPLVAALSLRMRKGNARVVVNARDPETGRMGTARANVHVE